MKVSLKLKIGLERLEDLKKEYGNEIVKKSIEMMLIDYFEEEDDEIGKIEVEKIEVEDF